MKQKEKLLGQILGQRNKVFSQIEDLQECLNLNVNLDKTFREKNLAFNLSFQSEIAKTSDMSRLLQNELGKTGGSVDGLTDWDSIQNVMEDASALKEEIETLNAKKSFMDEIVNLKRTISSFPDLMKASKAQVLKIRHTDENLSKLEAHYVNILTAARFNWVNWDPE